MGSLVGATLTVLLTLFTLCGAIPLGPCTSTGAQAVVNASGLCAVPVAPALSPVCGAQERSECGAQERYECGAQERYECAAQEHYEFDYTFATEPYEFDYTFGTEPDHTLSRTGASWLRLFEGFIVLCTFVSAVFARKYRRNKYRRMWCNPLLVYS